MDLKKYFTDRHHNFALELEAVKKRTNLISILRLVSILALIPVFYMYATTGNPIFIALGLVLVAAFIGLVTYHQNLYDKQQHLEALTHINKHEANALDGDFSGFGAGKVYLNSQHAYTYDMDVFGENSIFQALNRTCTALGEVRLSEIFSEPLKDKAAILERQEMLKDLSQKTEFRQNFQASGMTLEEKTEEVQALFEWFEESPQFINNKFLMIAKYLFPALLIASTIFWFFDPRGLILAVFFVLVNWLTWGFSAKKIGRIHGKVSRKNGVMSKYVKLLKIFSEEKFENPQIQNMQQIGKESVSEMKRFTRIVNNFDQRLNMLVGAFLNTVFLFDLHCVTSLEKWKLNNRKNIRNWLDVLFEIDALNSLANFAYCRPHFIYPEINTDSFIIKGKAMGHPLIAEEDCVTNDFDLGESEKMAILTGANMSGKSTFLRTLGVNTILALIGSPVYAKQFNCPILTLMTSMRLTDSLKERESYFYAELKRLQSIVQSLEKGERMFIILDEILKGTNSEDKLTGSIALIQKFVKFNSLGIIATHDLDLGKLEGEMPGKVSNICFESIIEDDKLSFDYTLNDGIAKNKNATFLMNQMKIV